MKILAVHVADEDEEQLLTAIAKAGVETILLPQASRGQSAEVESVMAAAEIVYRKEMIRLAPEGRAPKAWDDLTEDGRHRFAFDHTADTGNPRGRCRRPVITAMAGAELETFLEEKRDTTA